MPLAKTSLMPLLTEVVISDHCKELKKLQNLNIKLQNSRVFRSEIIDWTRHNKFTQMGISPDLIIATDVVFDGSPYPDFVYTVR